MPRAGLTTETVVDAAADLADDDGLGTLTLAALAQRLGVRPPSLYAHVAGLADLQRRLADRGARELGAVLAAAATGRAGRDALAALADAYRRFARDHPGTYAALQRAPELRGDPRVAAQAVDVVVAALRSYQLDRDDALHAVRIIRAALHGFVSLEQTGGFGLPLGLDATFERMVDVLHRGLAP